MEFPQVLANLIGEYDERYKLYTIFQKNYNKINWDLLSFNKNAFDELVINPDKINYINLALNENSNVLIWFFEHFEEILEKYFNYNYNNDTYTIFSNISSFNNVNYEITYKLEKLGSNLSQNTNDNAIKILLKYPKFINWNILYTNPNDIAVKKLILPKIKNDNKKKPIIPSMSILFKNSENIVSRNKTLNIHDNNFLIKNSNDIIVDILLEKPYYPYNYFFLSENSNPRIIEILEYKLNDIEKNRGTFGYISRDKFIGDLKNINKHTHDKFLNFLENNLDIIDYNLLSSNNSDKAIQLLLKNKENINWNFICSNTNTKAINMLFDKFYSVSKNNLLLKCLNKNQSTYAVNLLIKYPELIDWNNIWSNPYIFKSITSKEKTPIKKILRSTTRKYKTRKRSFILPKSSKSSKSSRSYRSKTFKKQKKLVSI